MFHYVCLASGIFFVVKNSPAIINFVARIRENAPMIREIYRTTSWRTITDFCIFKARIKITSHFETGLLQQGPSTCNLVYYDGATRYSVRFPKKRGPCTFSQVTTSNASGEEKDVTEQIREFGGPSHNFHGIPTTPGRLDFENLTFTYRNGTVRTFQKDDVIILEPLTKPSPSE